MGNSLILGCPTCGTKNRIPPDRVNDRPICGRCKTSLPVGGVPFDVTDAGFQAAVLEAPLPVLVDFWAPWCGPCKVVGPEVEAVAAARSGRTLVAKCNVDENPSTASRFSVQGVPTLILFRGGGEVGRLVGAHPRNAIEALVARAGV